MLEAVIYGGLACYCLASLLAVILLVRPAHFSDRWVLTFSSAGCVAFAAALLIDGLSTEQIPLFGRFEAITCYSIAVSVAYVLLATRESMRGLSAFVLPYVTALLFLAGTPSPFLVPNLPPYDTVWLAVHVSTAFIGYGSFTVASAVAASYLLQDFNLKNKRLGHVFERLPSLETADRAMRRQIAFAFTIFTVSVLTGVRLAHFASWQAELLKDPKIITVLLTWLLYAGLLAFCAYSRRHGKRIAQLILIGLFFVLFSFLGVNVITSSTHDFSIDDPAGETTGQ